MNETLPAWHVTLTGADDDVDIHRIYDLSRRYPFVEWGILFSLDRQGTLRYPTAKWRRDLVDRCPFDLHLRLSAHLCGSLSRAVSQQVVSFTDMAFARYQLNNFSIDNDSLPRSALPVPIVQASTQDALDKIANELATMDETWAPHVLVDGSCGQGIEPSSWPTPLPHSTTGFAGGIGPHNVRSVLLALDTLRRQAGVTSSSWIDMESKIRTGGNKFDLNAVEDVLAQVQDYNRERPALRL